MLTLRMVATSGSIACPYPYFAVSDKNTSFWPLLELNGREQHLRIRIAPYLVDALYAELGQIRTRLEAAAEKRAEEEGNDDTLRG